MLGFQTYWEPIAIGVDTLVVYLLYRAYKSRGLEADQLYNTPTFEVGPRLQSAIEATPEKSLDYVCVEGVTEFTGEPLRSQFTTEVGVVQRHLLVEHKSKRTQGTWTDFRRIVHNAFNYRPFSIANADRDLVDSKHKVEVTEILAAEYLDDYLPIVHDQYNPTKNGLLSRSMDLIFGEVTKGYQDTEKLLGIGVPILGVGRVTFDGRRMILQPPSDNRRYIVTTLSKPDVVRSLRSSARTIKILLWIFVVVGTGVAAYSLYKFVVRRMREMESRRMMDEIRRMRASDAGNDDGDDDAERSRCVVCLNNARDVVILNCGHVCLCGDCAEAIPDPKHCPVCRARVVRFVPVYIS